MFVRHCASLSTSIIHEGSRVHRETCAYARVLTVPPYERGQSRGAVFHEERHRIDPFLISIQSAPGRRRAVKRISVSRPCLRPLPRCLSPPLALTQPRLSPITPTGAGPACSSAGYRKADDEMSGTTSQADPVDATARTVLLNRPQATKFCDNHVRYSSAHCRLSLLYFSLLCLTN